jgi:hypothetical protein
MQRAAIGVLGVVVPTALSLTFPDAPIALLIGLWTIAALALLIALWHPLQRYVNTHVLLRKPPRARVAGEKVAGEVAPRVPGPELRATIEHIEVE